MYINWIVSTGFSKDSTFALGLLVSLSWLSGWPSPANSNEVEAELIAIGSISGTARDLSGFTGTLEEGTLVNQIGGFSAIDYSGHENRYWVLADRGPADGAASYPCRLHDLALDINSTDRKIQLKVMATLPLLSSKREPLMGSLRALQRNSQQRGNALDPEGLRLFPSGCFAISDEYGPSVDLFSAQGVRERSWKLPKWMQLTRERNLESARRGAMPNRGLEGLTVSTDGKSIIAAMEGPLIQDSYAKGKKRYSDFTRVIELPIEGPRNARHWLYRLSDPSNGLSEILAIDRDHYLVIERDGETRSKAKCKRIYSINTNIATDVADRDQIDPKTLPKGVREVSKQLVIDLLDPNLKIPGVYSLEKPEGLTWGPLLPDGRRVLIVCFDNDFISDQDSLFLAFAL